MVHTYFSLAGFYKHTRTQYPWHISSVMKLNIEAHECRTIISHSILVMRKKTLPLWTTGTYLPSLKWTVFKSLIKFTKAGSMYSSGGYLEVV